MAENEPLAHGLYERLVVAADSGDEEVVNELLGEAEKLGLPISLRQEARKPNWDNDYPSVTVDYDLRLGSIVVARWQAEFSGHWGGGGTGWWIDQLNSAEPDGMRELLSCANIEVESPDVPSRNVEVEDEDEDE